MRQFNLEDKMRRSMIAAATVLLLAARVVDALGDGRHLSYSERLREEARRDLPSLIEMLRGKNPPIPYEFVVQRISYSEDPRAVEPMTEVLADTSVYVARGADPYEIAAGFLAKMGDRRAVPVLRRNLTLTRWRLASAAESLAGVNRQDMVVRLACAAALFRFGELKDALAVLGPAVTSTYAPGGYVPKNLDDAIYVPIDAYRNRPEAMDTIHRFFRDAARSDVPTVRAAAAWRLVGVDDNLALAVAKEEVLRTEETGYAAWLVGPARCRAVKVLKAIGTPEARRLLKLAVADPDEDVSRTAQDALREMDKERK